MSVEFMMWARNNEKYEVFGLYTDPEMVMGRIKEFKESNPTVRWFCIKLIDREFPRIENRTIMSDNMDILKEFMDEKIKEITLRKEAYIFVAKQCGVSLEKFWSLKENAMDVLAECDEQSHLHGEDEPTPSEYIARECYMRGYNEGRKDGVEGLIDDLGLRDAYEEAKEEATQKEMEELAAKIQEHWKKEAEIMKQKEAEEVKVAEKIEEVEEVGR
jgi:hypothetical protein